MKRLLSRPRRKWEVIVIVPTYEQTPLNVGKPEVCEHPFTKKLLSISAYTCKPQGLHRTPRNFPPGIDLFRLNFRQISSGRGTLTLILTECGVRLHAEYSGPKCGFQFLAPLDKATSILFP